jgi:hypothetical protein
MTNTQPHTALVEQELFTIPSRRCPVSIRIVHSIASLRPHVLWKTQLQQKQLTIFRRRGTALGRVWVAHRATSTPQQKALAHRRAPRRASPESGHALVRYIQLHRQCSEEAAYQRLAAFIKQRRPFDDQSSLEGMLVHDRQGLVKITQDLLGEDPDMIDTI